jgi:murein DD-endopeptidase MepM/ murein hydrolase activator NlpD
VRNDSARAVRTRAAEPGRQAKPGRHRKIGARLRVLGLPLVPTIGVACALALVAGGTAAAAAGGSTSSDLTTSLSSSRANIAAQDSARTAAAGRADRTRTAQASAAAAGRQTAAQRAAWVKKSAASQRALAVKLNAGIVAENQVELTATTLASNKAAAAKGTAGVSTSGRYVLPVGGGVDRDTFGMTGPHWVHRHTGQDFPVALGTGVRAVSSGKVLETGWAGAYGNRMKLLLDDGTEIWYCHLSSYVVTSGRVSAGEIVARSGSTGNSTGPHLHMEVHLKQNPVASDPLNWLRSKGLKI